MEFSSLDTSACCNIIGSKITFYIRDKNGKNFRYFLRHQTCKNACREERKSVWVFLLLPSTSLMENSNVKNGPENQIHCARVTCLPKKEENVLPFLYFFIWAKFFHSRKPSGAMWKGLPSLSLSHASWYISCVFIFVEEQHNFDILHNNSRKAHSGRFWGQGSGFEGFVTSFLVLRQNSEIYIYIFLNLVYFEF